MAAVTAVGLIRYLTTTVSVGGVLGAAHGYSRTVHTPAERAGHHPVAEGVLMDGIQGAVMGPWVPITAPLTAFNILPISCPYIRKVLYDSGVFATTTKNLNTK